MKYLKTYESLYTIRKDYIDMICKKYNIHNYTINSDMSIDVDGNVDISNKNLSKLPLKFSVVDGIFDCSNNNLLNFIGIPKRCKRLCLSNTGLNDMNVFKYIYDIETISFSNNEKLVSFDGCNVPVTKLDFYSTPLYNLIYILMCDLFNFDYKHSRFSYSERLTKYYEYLEDLKYRMDEFDLINKNNIDLISLDGLYSFYNKDLDINKFQSLKVYEIY